MSTFNGLVHEFPDIRIDFFRRQPDRQPPLACFLSHVHSDHLAGLDTLRSPFVYCSAATKEILVRLEKYHCRINHVRGILEAKQQTYRHLRKVLKSLPLEAPTTIELRPGHSIQVTLFDANHCVGSVMFLIEGQGNAILYTGDVRSEPWFVNSIARNPCLLEYTCGLKTLDKIYLDTSFLDDVPFQTKAEGISDLLKMVSKYPKDTVFHFQAWTFGYEEVWVALSKFLNSRIHVDEYKLRLYKALKTSASDKPFAQEFHLSSITTALTGHMCGNTPHPGCLTSDHNVRIHSCEKANMCEIAKSQSVVSIRPVVAKLPTGETLVEVGVGGGGNDFSRTAELNWITQEDVKELVETLPSDGPLDSAVKEKLTKHLLKVAASGRSLSLDMDIDDFDSDLSADVRTALQSLYPRFQSQQPAQPTSTARADGLPKAILFPFARHSTYRELCDLVEVFRPRDIWPCTVDPGFWAEKGLTIRSMFGAYCSGQKFEHDMVMAQIVDEVRARKRRTPTPDSRGNDTSIEITPKRPRIRHDTSSSHSPARDPSALLAQQSQSQRRRFVSPLPSTQHPAGGQQLNSLIPESDLAGRQSVVTIQKGGSEAETATADASSPILQPQNIDEESEVDNAQDSQVTNASITSGLRADDPSLRVEAYTAMFGAMADDWRGIPLLSTDANHSVAETEL